MVQAQETLLISNSLYQNQYYLSAKHIYIIEPFRVVSSHTRKITNIYKCNSRVSFWNPKFNCL